MFIYDFHDFAVKTGLFLRQYEQKQSDLCNWVYLECLGN